MGACSFVKVAKGDSAQEAFDSAVKEAQYQHGHDGYSGTIAEKDSFKLFNPSQEWLKDMIEERRHHDHKYWKEVDDKYGPAGCFDLGGGEWMFFGWASE